MGGRRITGLTLRVKDQQETSADSETRGGLGADERKDLEELLSHYPPKRPLKIKTQTYTSHPRCVLEEIWFP